MKPTKRVMSRLGEMAKGITRDMIKDVTDEHPRQYYSTELDGYYLSITIEKLH